MMFFTLQNGMTECYCKFVLFPKTLHGINDTICHLKESIHISIGIFVKLFVNGKRTAFTQFLLHPEKKTACFQVEARLCLS